MGSNPPARGGDVLVDGDAAALCLHLVAQPVLAAPGFTAEPVALQQRRFSRDSSVRLTAARGRSLDTGSSCSSSSCSCSSAGLFISQSDTKAAYKEKAKEEEEEEGGGLFTYHLSKTITYYYQDAHNTPPPPNGHHDGGCRRSNPPPPTSPSPAPRPLALLLPWLGARREAQAKYRDLYLRRGMDVLAVESSVWHFLWPRWGLDYGLQVLRLLLEEPWLAGRPVLVHAFSIGGYTFSMMLCHVAQGPERYARLTQRVTGHIYDSMVAGSLEHMATGLGKALFPRLEAVVKNAAMLFFWLCRRHTADLYDSSLHVFRHNPVRAPALFFFCDNDAMCDPDAIEAVIDLWRGRGVAVERRRWAKSVHAAHLRCHRDEYLAALETFLSSLPAAPGEARD
ncbi:unnamed protein product [Merluccius merluccius]